MNDTLLQLKPLDGNEYLIKDTDIAAQYCGSLLKRFGGKTSPDIFFPVIEKLAVDNARDWAESGLIELTGNSGDTPLQGPGFIPGCARGTLDAIRLVCGRDILPGVNGATLLSERAAALNLGRQGQTSPNGSCHILKTVDSWIAINMSRDDDWELLPALLESRMSVSNLIGLSTLAKLKDADTLVIRGQEMGIPIARIRPMHKAGDWLHITEFNPERIAPVPANKQPLVVDLSSLWAGPLCSHILQKAGARVIKVESSKRLDGARQGSADFFSLLNGDKFSVTLDLDEKSGQRELLKLLARADIVIEGSRPRALEQMGIFAERMVQRRPGMIWISITGYGRSEPERNWVAFGDDAAVAAGVAHATASPPMFCGDALGDPLTGLHAAFVALAFWQSGKGGLFDIALSKVTEICLNYSSGTNCQRGTVSGDENQWRLDYESHQFHVKPPQVRPCTVRAAEPGTHTDQVMKKI